MSREEHLRELVRQGQALRQEDIDLGVKQERERIISLLLDEYGEMSEPGGYILDNDNYPARLHELIALIKGEK